MEDHQRASVSSGLVETDQLAVLVWQHNLREGCADSRANVAEVNTEICYCRHIFSSAQGWSA